MNRKELLQTAVIASPILLSGKLFSQDTKSSDSGKTGGKYGALIDATTDCLKKGELCISHCVDMMAGGDKTMGPCAKSVRDMLTMCDTLVKLATSNSEFTKKHASLCLEVCKKCEDECKKHPKHKVCMNCAESCKACIAEINKIIG
ncbi:MAG TPA: four-helix bundle copper-binding protein [Leptospiraceae bacterium]|nr:four-helix bundle copper-binding protein [Leptospiraceae bacterium]HMW06371.1 four-helix bundle copper-binding protein [Leptospiraceae bacterium]HMX31717.1 four-helix bundle copper-binding protein [Leptospiraceae bacterium]HMY32003.1 four-helix bundle copper-binding protein [Leptospiraceae bacterium]HMZ65784.1 four-helix bundle copper-binding protein [Leptospiraceae bacterium]